MAPIIWMETPNRAISVDEKTSPIMIVLSALRAVAEMSERKYTKLDLRLCKLDFNRGFIIWRFDFCNSMTTRMIAMRDDRISKSGISMIFSSFLTKKTVRMKEIVFITTKRIVIIWIISSPRKRKSKRKIERKIVRYERSENIKCWLRIGRKILAIKITMRPIPPSKMRARRVSARIC